jgi:hypothetical protein
MERNPTARLEQMIAAIQRRWGTHALRLLPGVLAASPCAVLALTPLPYSPEMARSLAFTGSLLAHAASIRLHIIRWEGHEHTVIQIIDRWRVDDGWWRRRVWREYFQLITRSGLLVLIYHDVRAAEWRLQRLYD